MTTLSQLRKAALGLPEVEEGTHFGMVAFSVRGKGFASVTKDGWVQLQMGGEGVDKALGAHPQGERLERAGKVIGFRVPLKAINGKDLNELVYVSWSHRAPKRLAAALAGAQKAAAAGPVGDLPSAIGKPATRALLGAGIESLEQVAGHSEAELLELHGMGPKAVRILQEAMTERGLTFRS
ncbi:hypothetical protein [Streptomyces indicus]|uniref:Helix-hairpin-helix domain-containing protein n=1 Tax=Streptomyces indicus TaxID=417292 RepID=A0A1G8ZWH1_9ACTN|nr:hypothetical protein [Streptomyces indicus]SDK19341.1 hypothetical protein SAMN05421806_105228 [Streptomyces indicus]